jgi:hypothetical protein
MDDATTRAEFCPRLPELAAALRDRHGPRTWDRAVRAVREGTPVQTVWVELGMPLYLLTGMRGAQTSREVTPGGVVRGLGRPASGEAYRCPDGRCDRVVVREPGGPIPADRCWLRDTPLVPGEA